MDENLKKLLKARSNTPFYHVTKIRNCNCRNNVLYVYKPSKHNAISSVDINKLEKKVRDAGFEWYDTRSIKL